MRIGLLTDLHYADKKPAGTRYYRETLDKLAEAAERFKKDGPAFVVLFVSATLLGIVSHVPGGLGVFEATMLAAAAPTARAQVLAALLAYRAIYNLLPCALALLALATGALRGRMRGEFSSTAGTRA